MATFIKTGFWEKRINPPQGYKGELNLDQLIAQNSTPGATGPQGPQGAQGIQGNTGTPGPVGPAGLNWQGAWVSGTSYVADDAVGYDGASWFCILATSGTTNPDVDTTHWALLASQGAIGPAGAQGPTGPQGAGATQTLQQTVDLGNTITFDDDNTYLYAGYISLYNNISTTTIIPSGITVGSTGVNVLTINNNQIFCNKGTSTCILNFPTTTSFRTINLPNASGTLAIAPTVAGNYANDAAAATAGIAVGQLYHTAGVVKIRLV